MEDFHAFQSTTGENSGGGPIVCLSPAIIAVIVIVVILYVIGKQFG